MTILRVFSERDEWKSAWAAIYDTIAKDGARHEPDDWRDIDTKEHWAHARDHLDAWRYGARDPIDLGHAIVRLLFILELEDKP